MGCKLPHSRCWVDLVPNPEINIDDDDRMNE